MRGTTLCSCGSALLGREEDSEEFPATMRLHLLALASAFTTACVSTETPVVAACRTAAGVDTARSGGTLTALPSLLPGVQITQASWRTHASSGDGVATEYLVFSTTLHADRKVEQPEIAILYDAPGAHAVVDNGFVDEGAQQFQLSDDAPFLDAGARRTTTRAVPVRTGYRVARTSALDYCPRTVRVVPRNTIALELMPKLRTVEGRAALLQVATRADASPLVVLIDTAVSDGPGSSLVTGAALNTTDSTLTNMVVALIPATSGARSPQEGAGRPSVDTLEYFVGTVPPNAIATFAGGWLNEGERIVARVTYRSTDVSGRPVAGNAHRHRVSEAGRDSRQRASRRAQCDAYPINCAK
jgi:hypothetical protein